MSFGRFAAAIIILWAFLYTTSFGVWTWKKKNKLGAIMVFVIAIASVVLPIYSVYFRRG